MDAFIQHLNPMKWCECRLKKIEEPFEKCARVLASPLEAYQWVMELFCFPLTIQRLFFRCSLETRTGEFGTWGRTEQMQEDAADEY